jgi:hypothetical protein
MSSESGALFINKIVPLRKKIANEPTLDQFEAFRKILSGSREDFSCQKNAPTVLRISQVLHKSQIVEMAVYPSPDSICLSDV